VTPKGQGRDHIIFETLCLHNGARYTHALRYNKTNGNWRHRPFLEIFLLSVPKIGQYFMNFGETISNNDLDACHY